MTYNWTLEGLVKKPDPIEQELDLIAGRVAREHSLATRAGADFVKHAITAGEALVEARAKVTGGWKAWLDATLPDLSYSTVKLYVRLARHKDKLADEEPTSLRAALELLRGEPDSRIDDEKRAEARSLRRDGMKLQPIADHLGVAVSTVCAWVDERPPVAAVRAPRAESQRRPSLKSLVKELLDGAQLLDGEYYGYLVSAELIRQMREAVDGA